MDRITPFRFIFAGLLAAILGGCSSVNHLAVNKLGDALASGGTAFGSDSDPELIRDAAPFSLKLMESLLAENPRHAGLLYAAASGFTQYSYAFVQQEADTMEEHDVAAAAALRARARGLYLRGRDYGLRGLELAHPGLPAELRRHPAAALRSCRPDDVRLLYWTAVSWAAAIAAAKDDPALIADLPLAEALIDRALELDESFDHGAIHAFLITYEMSRPGGSGDPAARARQHFERAMQLSANAQASPLVAYAEAVCVTKQDRAQFQSSLNRALAIDVNARPEFRLVNLVMQRRARWLLGRIDELFLPADSPASS
jgi:predicted anti-sigma-YlaC factor YlaD